MSERVSFSIRDATTDDADGIRDIYNVEATTGTATLDIAPRSLAEQQTWLRERSGVHVAIVAVADDGEIIGFASLSPYKDKACYASTVENSIYVHRGHQRIGVGRGLLMRLIDRAHEHGFHSIIARIGAANTASIGLHESVGYGLVGVEKEVGRKFGRWLDVALLQRMIED